jgi:CheY-like chemotaxis protein
MRHLILADDSTTIQKVIQLSFSEEDFEIHIFGNGTGALEYVRSYGGDVVLADISLPHVDGYDLCREIRQDPRTSDIPVVLLAGTFEPFDADRAREAGYSSLLIKPFETTQLVELVTKLANRAAGPTAYSTPSSPRARHKNSVAVSRFEMELSSESDDLDSQEPEKPEVLLDLPVLAVKGEVFIELSSEQCRPSAQRLHTQSDGTWEQTVSGLSSEQLDALMKGLMERLPQTLRTLLPQIAREVLKT